MIRLVSALFSLWLALAPVQAAVTANSFVAPQTPNRGVVQFLQGADTAGTYKTLYTAGANGSRCYGMWATNNDASVLHLITVQVVSSTVKYGGVALQSINNAGFATATPAQNLMSSTNWPGLPVDALGNPYLQLISGDTIQATFGTALTSSDVINIQVTCADF